MRWMGRANKALPLNISNLLAQTCNAAGKDGYQAAAADTNEKGLQNWDGEKKSS